ncbi:hypothetical protein PV327_011566, partial [Microctonus hyperodae]
SNQNTIIKIIEGEKDNFDNSCNRHDAVDSTNTFIQERSPLKEITNAQCTCGLLSIPTFNCKICKIPVHASNKCSVLDENSDDIDRICQQCNTSNNLNFKISLNEIENHKGLARQEMKGKVKKERQNLYLGQSSKKIADTLSFHSNTIRIPILKNGISMGLAFIKIESKQYYFKNTCGFDSLAQILLAAALDFPVIKEKISQLDIPFFILINDLIKKGITSNTYRQRGNILLKFSNKKTKTNPVHVDCATAVNTLYEYLFKECPSFYKLTKCLNKCPISK